MSGILDTRIPTFYNSEAGAEPCQAQLISTKTSFDQLGLELRLAKTQSLGYCKILPPKSRAKYQFNDFLCPQLWCVWWWCYQPVFHQCNMFGGISHVLDCVDTHARIVLLSYIRPRWLNLQFPVTFGARWGEDKNNKVAKVQGGLHRLQRTLQDYIELYRSVQDCKGIYKIV